MGYYIDPVQCTKEHWLETYGQRVTQTTAMAHSAVSAPALVVCLVDNGWMTAAGICYDDRERDCFSLDDGRPKIWYLVPKRDLLKFLPERLWKLTI